MLECVVNVSEGRDHEALRAIGAAGGDHVLDLHADPDHHRAVITLAGPDVEQAVRAVARRTVELLDVRHHQGVHPWTGALDVVPFVPLGPNGAPAGPDADLAAALEARRRFAEWAGAALDLPCFYYGPERSLPEVRRQVRHGAAPDTGPTDVHTGAGACCVGARGALVAYNVWLATDDVSAARAIAGAVRSPAVRTLGLPVGGVTQVSTNLLDPYAVGPAAVLETVRRLAEEKGVKVLRGEIVGLAPLAVVEAVPAGLRPEVGLDVERTVEARLRHARRSGREPPAG